MRINKRKYFYPFLFGVLFFILLNFNPIQIPGQQAQEEVTVTAIEVPVRVIQNGHMVKDLTKEDFELFENGVKQEITAFESVSRKISASKEIPPEERGARTRVEQRLFILIFNIFDYNDGLGKGIDYFFENVFQSGDQIMIITEDRLLNIERGKSQSEMIRNLKDTLKKYKVISTSKSIKAYQDLRVEADRLLSSLRGTGKFGQVQWDQSILRFYENYRRIWLEFKRQFIIPDAELYRSIIKRIKQIEGEKWALCFQQREMFPKLKNESPLEREIRGLLESMIEPQDRAKARNIQSRQMELQRIMNAAGDIPAEVLRNLFIEGNITFHLILLSSPRTLVSKDFELKQVSQDYEECFKQISFATGGHSTFSNKISEALNEASETEDYYYLLVYSPKDNQADKKREVEVQVNKSGVDIIHLKQIPEIEAPSVAISGFEVKRKVIKFSMRNYRMTKLKDKTAGSAEVKITIYDKNSEKVFDEGKALELIDKETNISLNFNWLKPGQYFIIIQVVDRIAKETDVFSSNFRL